MSGSTDKTAKVWDARSVKSGPSGPQIGGNCEISLHGHEYAVRKVQWNPHRSDLVASASYDMTCRVCVYLIIRHLSISPGIDAFF